MTSRTRRSLFLAAATLSGMVVALPGSAQSLFHFATASLAEIGDRTLTTNFCDPVTPAVLDLSLSVPPAGSGNACTNDTQCTGYGEACTFPLGATTGTCSASGLLSRDDIHYVAGGLLDVDVTVPACANVTDVLMDGASLSGGGGFDSTTPASWWMLSSVATTVNGQAAYRQRVRVQFPNFGDGMSSSLRVQVTSFVGGATIQSAPFLLSRVAAVNAAIRSTVAETRIRNEFVTSLYRKFGDYDQVFEDGERIAYGLNWSQLSAVVLPSGVHYRGSDIRIGTGQIAFSTQFKGDEPGCDPNVYADGWFTLAPAGDGVQLQWIVGPRVEVDASGVCAVLSLGIWDLVTDGFADEEALSKPFATTISAGFGADENGHIKVCDLCRVVDVAIGGGKIEIWTIPPTGRVRLNVSPMRGTDPTADPSQGLLLPAGMYAPIVGGGSYESCQAADGSSPATCPTRFAVDAEGLFNWWGSDVPVPSPIYCNEYGVCAVLGGRQSAWARLQGLTRQVTMLPEKSFPAGALLARRTPTNVLMPTTRARVSNGCVLPPDTLAPYKVSFGVNDITTFPGGAVPVQGKLDATVLLADSVAQSATLFDSSTTCKAAAAPATNSRFGGGIGLLSTLR